MSTTLETKLRTQAAAYAPLTALIGSPPRWWDTQLQQGSALPAVTVQLISGNKTYALNGRLPTGWSRYQLTVWDTDPERARAVETALANFLDQFNAIGIVGLALYPCQVVLQRQMMFPLPEPPRFMRITDAQIFSNDNV